jgi:hypothetical protein
MSRLTAIACVGLAVAGPACFAAGTAAADTGSVQHTSTWSKTYELRSHTTKTYRLQLPKGFHKAPARSAIEYSLAPRAGSGHADSAPITAKGAGKQKPFLGATVVRSKLTGQTATVRVRTAKLSRPLALELSARGTVATSPAVPVAPVLGDSAAEVPVKINITGLPAQQLVLLQFDQALDYRPITGNTTMTPQFNLQGNGARVMLPNNAILVGGSSTSMNAQINVGADTSQLSGTATVPAGATVTMSVNGGAPVNITGGQFNVG